MATGQSLLNIMELTNQELQLQTGEADVARGLVALNVAQDHFEALAAGRIILGLTIGTVVTSAGVESTAFPTGVLRIDRLVNISTQTALPTTELIRLHRTGGHASAYTNSLWSGLSTTTGVPRAYWTNGSAIYWAPTPSGTYTVRWYGCQAAADLTAVGTFTYPDLVMLPLASFAAQLMKSGVDDAATDVASLATSAFTVVLDTLSRFNRDGASGFEYTRIHTE